MNRYNKSVLMLVLALAFGSVSVNQAYALNDDEAAVLMGLAVGGITAYAVKHHREHDRKDWSAATVQHPPRHYDPYSKRDWGRHGEHHGRHHPASYSRPFHSRVVIIDNRRGGGHKSDYYPGYGHRHGHRHGASCGNIRF